MMFSLRCNESPDFSECRFILVPGAQKTKKVNSESLNLQISRFMVSLFAENHHFCWLNLHFPSERKCCTGEIR